MEPTSESDELMEIAKVKNEIISDDEPTTTITEGPEEPEEASSDVEHVKKFSCPTCHKRYNSEMDLLNHFRYECEQSGTISAATVSNGLPSLLTNIETSEANAVSTATTIASTGISSSPSPRYSSPKMSTNNHYEKLQQQHFLHSQKPFIQQFENAASILPKTDMSGRFQPPILLPITVHSDDPYSIRVIGPPQFIIPIAVGRKTDLLVSSLHVDPLLSGSITIPSTLPILNGIPNFSIPIHSTLPQQILPPSNSTSFPPAHHHHPLPIKRPRISTDSRPLDLSLKAPKRRREFTTATSSKSECIYANFKF
uniref:C2H2-type domain-containing protein n=1 Tax=Panagrolaimus sp. PS1159 TaxID=55785 RepID=A0AC35EVF2_9BILA